jgi:hypothetical protein
LKEHRMKRWAPDMRFCGYLVTKISMFRILFKHQTTFIVINVVRYCLSQIHIAYTHTQWSRFTVSPCVGKLSLSFVGVLAHYCSVFSVLGTWKATGN